MCGIVGVVLKDRARRSTAARSKRMTATARASRSGRGGGVLRAGRRLRPPAALDRGSVGFVCSADGQRFGDRALTFNGEVYNWTGAAGRAFAEDGASRVAFDAATPRCSSPRSTRGVKPRSLASRGCSRSVTGRRRRARSSSRATASARSRSTTRLLARAASTASRSRRSSARSSRTRACTPSAAIDADAVAQFFLPRVRPGAAVHPRERQEAARRPHARPGGTAGASRIERYYRPPYASTNGPGEATPAELTADLVQRVEASTRARLVADVPVGVFLSGGLDSSFLAACAVRVHPRVKTFTVAFDDASFDESEHARLVAKHLGTEHVEHRLEARALIDLVPSVARLDGRAVRRQLTRADDAPRARGAARTSRSRSAGTGAMSCSRSYPTFVVDEAIALEASRVADAACALRWRPLCGSLAAARGRRTSRSRSSFGSSRRARQRTARERHASWLAPLLPLRPDPRLAGPRLKDELDPPCVRRRRREAASGARRRRSTLPRRST